MTLRQAFGLFGDRTTPNSASRPRMRLTQAGALLLEAFTQPIHAQHALLGCGFDGRKHGGAQRCLANGSGIVGVVFTGLALQSIGRGW